MCIEHLQSLLYFLLLFGKQTFCTVTIVGICFSLNECTIRKNDKSRIWLILPWIIYFWDLHIYYRNLCTDHFCVVLFVSQIMWCVVVHNINEHKNSHDISSDKSNTKLWQKLINHLLCDVLMCCAVFVVANVCHLTFLYREPVLTVYLAKGTQILILMLSMFHTQFSDRNSLTRSTLCS